MLVAPLFPVGVLVGAEPDPDCVPVAVVPVVPVLLDAPPEEGVGVEDVPLADAEVLVAPTTAKRSVD